MTSGDVVAIVGAAATLITTVASAVTLIRRHSEDLSKREQIDLEDCSAWRRTARRVIRQLRDLLAEHNIPEPEGLDDELSGRRADAEEK
jgi:hypothetical protein